MAEKPKGIELPKEKRYRYFPVLEDAEIAQLPARVREQVERHGLTEEAVRAFAIQEFVKAAGISESEVKEAPDLQNAADVYFGLLSDRRAIKERIAALEAGEAAEAETGIAGLSRIFDSPFRADAKEKSELDSLRRELGDLENAFGLFRDRVRKYYKLYREADVRQLATLGSSDIDRQYALAREALFGLMKRGDALRKERVLRREEAGMRSFESRIRIFREAVALRQKAEDLLRADENERVSRAGEQAAEIRSDMEPVEVIERFLAPELGHLIDRVLDSQKTRPSDMPEEKYRKNIAGFLLSGELSKSADTLRDELEAKEDELGLRISQWREALRDPRNSDLAELAADRNIKELLEAYHVEKRRFLPVKELRGFIDSLDDTVKSPHGQILRALLYGPPGTGKTEALREIGRRHGQRVRVISLHETSSFETLVGMNQIPLPRSEQLADAEKFWEKISKLPPEAAVREIPEPVLEEFAGDTAVKKAEDFKKWFDAHLRAARAISALGAVSPHDPRVRKARQEALAAWLDQPLAEGLMSGDLVVLDEADRAGGALEGLQDLLTRRPGDLYQPPGRPEPFRIHPDARVVMTANWGDVQTEFTAGGGKLAAPIVSRVVEKRKIDYLGPETELALFEVMTSDPQTGDSLLKDTERDAADILVKKVFPKLRDFYLRPGQLQFITPISVRTLENIARRLIDESTRTRVRDERGNPAHFAVAAWQEIASGPWRADQRDTIIRELAHTFADQGLFDFLGDSKEAPRPLRAELLTGLPRTDLIAFVHSKFPVLPDNKLPENFSFGAILGSAAPAENTALRDTPVYHSFKSAQMEEERAWRRRIEDLGGTPEVQREIDKLSAEWILWHKDNESAFDDTERLFAEEVKFLREKIKNLEVRIGDLNGWVARHGEIYPMELAPALWKRTGLIFSMLLNRAVERMTPAERAGLLLKFDNFPELDYVGYRLSEIELQAFPALGSYAGRELNGGTLISHTLGHKSGFRMQDGKLSALRTGDRACQQMQGGEAEFGSAGQRLGVDARAGSIRANTAGDRAAQGSSALVTVKAAGRFAGQELKESGVLEITDSYASLGSGIKGDVISRGHKIIDKGRRVE